MPNFIIQRNITIRTVFLIEENKNTYPEIIETKDITEIGKRTT